MERKNRRTKEKRVGEYSNRLLIVRFCIKFVFRITLVVANQFFNFNFVLGRRAE